MTDEQNASPDISPAVESAPQSDTVQQSTTDTNASMPSEPVKQGKVFDEAQMRNISASVKRDVERKTEARLRAEFEAQLKTYQPQQQQTQTEQALSQPASSIAGLTEEQLYNNFRQRQEREQYELQTQNTTNDFLMKIQAAGKADKIESSGLGQIPTNHPLVSMLNGVDNIADVIDDFDSNPVKVANLLAITHLNPMNGFKALQEISQSIKRNKEALAKDKAPEPLTQLKPSSYGLGGGASSISEKRKNTAFKF